MKKHVIGIFMGTMLVICAAGSVLAGSVTIDDAKKASLQAVGIDEKDVVFGDCHEDTDDGRTIYEIEIFIPGELKYDFDIDSVLFSTSRDAISPVVFSRISSSLYSFVTIFS